MLDGIQGFYPETEQNITTMNTYEGYNLDNGLDLPFLTRIMGNGKEVS